MIVGLVLVLGAGGPGCETISGFRSIEPAPRRLGLLGRLAPGSKASPEPGADYYARFMHRSPNNEARLAAGPDAPLGPSYQDDAPGAARSETRVAARAERDRPGSSQPALSNRSSPPRRDETIHVTLGTPLPMPSLARSPRPVRDDDDASRLASLAPKDGPASGRAPASPSLPNQHQPERAAALASAPAPASSPGPFIAREAPPSSRPRETLGDAAPPAPGRAPKAKAAAPDLAQLIARGEAKLRSLQTYQVSIERTERVSGKLLPEEHILLSVRRDPKAVRLEWADGPSKGREVIYSTRRDPRSLFVHMPRGAIALPTMRFPVDSPLITKNSRHSITEAGLDTILANLRQSLEESASSRPGNRMVYHGIQNPPGQDDRPSHVLARHSPNGETWTVFLDARTLLPSMVVAKNAEGELDEKYVYHEVREDPATLTAANAFDPDQRWGGGGGLLSRFARAAAGASASASAGTDATPAPESQSVTR